MQENSRYIQQGTSAFYRANTALFAGGYSTFAILYCTQPLMPEFSSQFSVSPAVASLSLSVATITLAFSMLIFGSLSEVWGRKPIMAVSLLTASVFAVLTVFVTDFYHLLIFRVLEGMFLAGLPAVAMAYLGEEIEPNSLGMAMGLYISGNSIGGMSGRIITGMLADAFNWRIAMGGIGILAVLASFLFVYRLPASRHFAPRPLEADKLAKSMVSHLKDTRLLSLFAIGLLLMGSFVSLYNYIGYELLAPPYSLSQTVVGWIFVVYIVGTFSSTWMGRLADRRGRRQVLWNALALMAGGAVITLAPSLLFKIGGIAIFTFGFFGGHSIASSWVGSLAEHDKAQASSLYLFCYYAGSSIGGTIGGLFLMEYGWAGIITMVVCSLTIAWLLSVQLPNKTPLLETGVEGD